VAGRLEPREATPVAGPVVTLLGEALEKETDSGQKIALGQALAAVAGRLEPREAAAVAGVLIRAVEKETDGPNKAALAQEAAIVAGRLEAGEAPWVMKQLTGVLTRALEKEASDWQTAGLIRGLAAVAGRLEPGAAARAAGVLTRDLEQVTDANVLRVRLDGLAAVAGWLEPAEAVRVSKRTGDLLTKALKETRVPGFKVPLASGLVEVTGRLDPGATALVLSQALDKETDNSAKEELTRELANTALQMDPAKASQMCSPLIENLVSGVEKEKDETEQKDRFAARGCCSGRWIPRRPLRIQQDWHAASVRGRSTLLPTTLLTMGPYPLTPHY
jgi:hypothetical protein